LLCAGWDIERVALLSSIDRWFLAQIADLIAEEVRVRREGAGALCLKLAQCGFLRRLGLRSGFALRAKRIHLRFRAFSRGFEFAQRRFLCRTRKGSRVALRAQQGDIGFRLLALGTKRLDARFDGF